MKTYTNLFQQLCGYDNLLLAFNKAKKGKGRKEYVQKFEKNLKPELCKLQWELLTGIYQPAALTSFIVRDPKTRKISASHFRDRVIHHAICNIIEPIFESRFIYDNFANRKKKGTSGIVKRFDSFIRKVSNTKDSGFALKADIRHYFQNVDHSVLITLLRKRIKDEQLIDIIVIILKNYQADMPNKGMPLGNLTSQFFANIYLHELDHFVKQELKAKYYVRYVDDFVLLNSNKEQLEKWQIQIDEFLRSELKLILHPDKTRIVRIQDGVPLVGLKIFRYHKILKRSNRLRFFRKLDDHVSNLKNKSISKDHLRMKLAGWQGYAKMANTYNLRQNVEKIINRAENIEFG